MVDRSVDQIHRADQVVVVVEALDEMAQPFGGIGGEMIDVIERVALEEFVMKSWSVTDPWTKVALTGTFSRKPPLKIVHHDYVVSH